VKEQLEARPVGQQRIRDLIIDLETHAGDRTVRALVFDVFCKRDVETIQGAAHVNGCHYSTLQSPVADKDDEGYWMITVSGTQAQLQATLQLAELWLDRD
jgi:hypothetical protein